MKNYAELIFNYTKVAQSKWETPLKALYEEYICPVCNTLISFKYSAPTPGKEHEYCGALCTKCGGFFRGVKDHEVCESCPHRIACLIEPVSITVAKVYEIVDSG